MFHDSMDDIFITENHCDYSDNNGWDTDLETEELNKKQIFDVTGEQTYLQACNNYNVTPVSYFLRHLQDTELIMKHHGLGDKGAKAIAIPLVNNTKILDLDLEDNGLEGEGGQYIAKMLTENCYICKMNVNNNKLGSMGARAMGNMLSVNTHILSASLSGNEFKDKDATFFSQALKINYKIKELILSHNQFSGNGGKVLAEGIAANSSLETVDLSWNHIRMHGAIEVSNAIKENTSIKTLNLAWNGFGNEGAKAMGEALKYNNTLVELDLTNNRITTDGAITLAGGLIKNETLEILKISENPISSVGAYVLLDAIRKNPYSALTQLIMADIFVNKDFEDLLADLSNNGKSIHIVHGGFIGELSTVQENKDHIDPMSILKEYIQRRNLRLVDLFQQFDKDKSMTVSRQELMLGIESTGIPLTKEQLKNLIETLDKDGDGEIDYSEFSTGNQQLIKSERKKAKRNIKSKK